MMRKLQDDPALPRFRAGIGEIYDVGAVINAIPSPTDVYRERTGVMDESRKDG